jgi:hypothetical protein
VNTKYNKVKIIKRSEMMKCLIEFLRVDKQRAGQEEAEMEM